MKQIKLEVGKTYRNRKGEEVKIVWNDYTDAYPYLGSDGEWFTESGEFDVDVAQPDLDLIEEVAENIPHTFKIPDGVKEITVSQKGKRIVVEMVPEKGPKPGDVCINEEGSVYIFKEVVNNNSHRHYVWLGDDGGLFFASWGRSGRPATPEEAQPLFDALKKAGKRWNPETMRVEEISEFEHILEWVEANIKDGYYNHEDVAEVIESYIKHKEVEQ